jgi:hypothetical protein
MGKRWEHYKLVRRKAPDIGMMIVSGVGFVVMGCVLLPITGDSPSNTNWIPVLAGLSMLVNARRMWDRGWWRHYQEMARALNIPTERWDLLPDGGVRIVPIGSNEPAENYLG